MLRALAVAALTHAAIAFQAPSRSLSLRPATRASRAPVAVAAVDPHHATQMWLAAIDPAAAPIDKSGWFGTIVEAMENVIKFLHDVVGSYGVAIILFTLLLKAVTFPLNYAQIESTTKMQALQPAIKKVQAAYAADPEKMNLMMAQLYQENELNPLAGCLPSIVQIPVFIALYRALLSLAREDLLEEPFLWIPNLEGPVFGAQNADWLFKFDQWNGAVPPLGWGDTAAYLALPALLVVAQSVSTQLLQPPSDPDNEAAQTSNQVLKFLPLMVGFFSLNVPSGLTIYWFVNNLITTASTLYIKSTVSATQPVTMGGASAVAAPSPKKSSKKKKEATSFDDLVAAAPKRPAAAAPPPSSSPVAVDVVVDAAPPAAAASTAAAAPVVDVVDAESPAPADASADSDDGLSKSAAKKAAKAKKSRAKKSGKSRK